ncbi:MAG TPA: hypothetical protein VF053_15995 [Streptosporangiales bacterium]
MRWLAGRQRADSTGRAYLPPNTAWLPSSVLTDPTNGYLHVISAPGRFALYGSAQPYVTQRRRFFRRRAGIPEPGYGQAAQVPSERAARHRSADTAHGRHAVRTPGKGRGGWFRKQRSRGLFGLSRAEWKEVRSETVKFTGIGWTGLTANILGVIGAGGTLNGPTTVGLIAAMGWAPFQGMIAGIVNVSKMRKARPVDRRQDREISEIERDIAGLRNELVQAGYLPPTGMQAQPPQPAYHGAARPTAQARPPVPAQSYPQGAYSQGRPPAAPTQPGEAGRHRRGDEARARDPRQRGPEPRQPGP